MSYFPHFPQFDISFNDGPALDAFGRLRVSNPVTVFNSKQLHSKHPTDWDEVIGGSGATSVHTQNTARTRMSVSATTAGSVIRQTFRRFNYQPGKSQLTFLTADIDGLVANVTKCLGLFDDNNGVFFEFDAEASVIVRSNATGSPVDTRTTQANWNLDRMDGTGPSRVTLDWTKTQIFTIDYTWLGVGRVRFGFVHNGVTVICHEQHFSNEIDVVYMSSPNLPVRYSIENNGSGAATEFDHICSTVITEGGLEPTGRPKAINTGISTLSTSSGDVNAILGIRLAANHLDAVIEITEVSSVGTAANDVLLFEIIRNPTVADTLTWDTASFGAVDVVQGTPGTHTVTNGEVLFSKVGTGRFPLSVGGPSHLLDIGSSIGGTPQELFLVITGLNNANITAALNWRELA